MDAILSAKKPNLWTTFGKGKDLRWIPIHDIVRSLGPRSKALPFFHAFRGCDTVSAFVGKGKKTAWQGLECDRLATTYCCMFCMQKHTSVSFLVGARCYKVSIDSFVADNIFFLSNDVNDEMLLLTCGLLPFDE
jgi:hypothetical protein